LEYRFPDLVEIVVDIFFKASLAYQPMWAELECGLKHLAILQYFFIIPVTCSNIRLALVCSSPKTCLYFLYCSIIISFFFLPQFAVSYHIIGFCICKEGYTSLRFNRKSWILNYPTSPENCSFNFLNMYYISQETPLVYLLNYICINP
jgi:hypothetical protein